MNVQAGQSVDENSTVFTARTFLAVENLSAGHLFSDTYRLEKQIGRGGMGVIWRAYDEVADRRVVLKFIPKEVQNIQEAVDSVRDSFKKIHSLQHQHICPVYSLLSDSEHGLYLVMKYIDGLMLNEYKRRMVAKAGSMPFTDAVQIFWGVAQGLDYAHEKKVIHRDIKPQNIMISEADGVQIIDFGLAEEIRTSMMQHSQVVMDAVGTRPYMSPEQWMGKYQDDKTDQYALAVTAYELFSGHFPFYNTDISVLRESVLHDEPEPIQEIPSYVNVALRKAMAKNREDRFENCKQFVEALANRQADNRMMNPDNLFVSNPARPSRFSIQPQTPNPPAAEDELSSLEKQPSSIVLPEEQADGANPQIWKPQIPNSSRESTVRIPSPPQKTKQNSLVVPLLLSLGVSGLTLCAVLYLMLSPLLSDTPNSKVDETAETQAKPAPVNPPEPPKDSVPKLPAEPENIPVVKNEEKTEPPVTVPETVVVLPEGKKEPKDSPAPKPPEIRWISVTKNITPVNLSGEQPQVSFSKNPGWQLEKTGNITADQAVENGVWKLNVRQKQGSGLMLVYKNVPVKSGQPYLWLLNMAANRKGGTRVNLAVKGSKWSFSKELKLSEQPQTFALHLVPPSGEERAELSITGFNENTVYEIPSTDWRRYEGTPPENSLIKLSPALKKETYEAIPEFKL